MGLHLKAFHADCIVSVVHQHGTVGGCIYNFHPSLTCGYAQCMADPFPAPRKPDRRHGISTLKRPGIPKHFHLIFMQNQVLEYLHLNYPCEGNGKGFPLTALPFTRICFSDPHPARFPFTSAETEHSPSPALYILARRTLLSFPAIKNFLRLCMRVCV